MKFTVHFVPMRKHHLSQARAAPRHYATTPLPNTARTGVCRQTNFAPKFNGSIWHLPVKYYQLIQIMIRTIIIRNIKIPYNYEIYIIWDYVYRPRPIEKTGYASALIILHIM